MATSTRRRASPTNEQQPGARRIEATPAPLRPQVTGFADFLLLQREQAQQLGLRPN
jgi:hypothetical protein